MGEIGCLWQRLNAIYSGPEVSRACLRRFNGATSLADVPKASLNMGKNPAKAKLLGYAGCTRSGKKPASVSASRPPVCQPGE
jgi:hypothetical protein